MKKTLTLEYSKKGVNAKKENGTDEANDDIDAEYIGVCNWGVCLGICSLYHNLLL